MPASWSLVARSPLAERFQGRGDFFLSGVSQAARAIFPRDRRRRRGTTRRCLGGRRKPYVAKNLWRGGARFERKAPGGGIFPALKVWRLKSEALGLAIFRGLPLDVGRREEGLFSLKLRLSWAA